MKHTGIHIYRTADNPAEMVFSDQWLMQNGRDSNFLEQILRKNPHEFEGISERDASVAATIIQWLGSPVGECFLNNCVEEIELKGNER